MTQHSVELKLLLLSSEKSKQDKSKSNEFDFCCLITFVVFSLKVLRWHPSVEKLLVRCSSGSDVEETNLTSSWESVDSVDSLLSKELSKEGLGSLLCSDCFLRFRALNPMSSKMSYFSPPQRAVMIDWDKLSVTSLLTAKYTPLSWINCICRSKLI